MSSRPAVSVAGRLAMLLCGLAAVSTGVALVLQDSALDSDLRRAAQTRLAASADRTDLLIGDHLRTTAGRYDAISQTPELRANLDTEHLPTLSYYATLLLQYQGATLIAFVGPEGNLLTAAGDPRLISIMRERVGRPAEEEPDEVERAAYEALGLDAAEPTADASSETFVCIPAGDASRPDAPAAEDPWLPCNYPDGEAESSLFETRGDLYALVTVPLRSGQELEGGFVAIEALSEGTLARWSRLSGAALHTGTDPVPDGNISLDVESVPGVAIRVSTTYDAEQAIIQRARSNLVASGILALFLALGASVLLARAFARPILEMREATARLSGGDLDSRVEVEREDEIGQLGHAFNELATQLTDSQERVRRAQRLAQFGNWYFDFESSTFEGTREFRRLFELSLAKAIPLSALLENVRQEDREGLETALRRSRQRSTPFRLDVRVRSGDGRDRIIHVRGHSRNRTASRIEGSVQDVTDRRQAEEQIRYLSQHDALTGLGNRDRAMEELKRRIDGRGSDQTFAVLMIGIDDLQSVTDTFGHNVGDQLLVEIANRLVANVREEPRKGAQAADMVARFGDERFAAILDGVPNVEMAGRAAERLLSQIRGAYEMTENEISIVTSAGVALWPADGDDAETLLRNAETALTRVQRKQPGSTRFFDESMHTDASRRMLIASRLPRAIEEEQLELYYQPRVHPEDGSLVGFEGLARWTDEELGPVSPGEFIPVAEATGSIEQLGTWCIKTAAEQLKHWHRCGHDWLSVSVNLSHRQLKPDLVDGVVEATDGVDRAKFELEVTESALIEEGDSAIEALTALRSLGFKIALDDFGTGYSSLSYLQGLPLDTVKVDRAFIRDIADDEDAAALAGSVLTMCEALRLHTVVEGVETEDQLRVLIGLGYQEAQGFYFAKPMPSAETEEYIVDHVQARETQLS